MRRYLLPIFFMSLLYWSCEDDVPNEKEFSVELSIVRVDTLFQLNWTMNNEVDFLKYLVKTGTSSNNISEIIFETTDRLELSFSVPYTIDTKYYKVDVINLENEIASSNIVSINTDEIPSPLSDEFRRCAMIKRTWLFPPSNEVLYVDDFIWNGLVRLTPIRIVNTYGQTIDIDTIYYHYDNYGNQILKDHTLRDSHKDSVRSIYIDYWKLAQEVSFLRNGRIITTEYSWNELTQTQNGDEYYWRSFNEYGRFVSDSWGTSRYFLEDGRRIFQTIGQNYRSIVIWNNLEFEEHRWDSGIYTDLVVGRINIYGEIEEATYYDCFYIDCQPTHKYLYEYDCEKFDPIPVE